MDDTMQQAEELPTTTNGWVERYLSFAEKIASIYSNRNRLHPEAAALARSHAYFGLVKAAPRCRAEASEKERLKWLNQRLFGAIIDGFREEGWATREGYSGKFWMHSLCETLGPVAHDDSDNRYAIVNVLGRYDCDLWQRWADFQKILSPLHYDVVERHYRRRQSVPEIATAMERSNAGIFLILTEAKKQLRCYFYEAMIFYKTID